MFWRKTGGGFAILDFCFFVGVGFAIAFHYSLNITTHGRWEETVEKWFLNS